MCIIASYLQNDIFLYIKKSSFSAHSVVGVSDPPQARQRRRIDASEESLWRHTRRPQPRQRHDGKHQGQGVRGSPFSLNSLGGGFRKGGWPRCGGRWAWQVWQDGPGLATNSILFLFPFCTKSLICLEGKLMTPHWRNTILFRSSLQLPRLCLGPSTRLVRCFRNYRDTRTPSGVAC